MTDEIPEMNKDGRRISTPSHCTQIKLKSAENQSCILELMTSLGVRVCAVEQHKDLYFGYKFASLWPLSTDIQCVAELVLVLRRQHRKKQQ